MRKIIMFILFVFVAFGFYACNECTDCEENTRTLALYIKAQGNAKDSVIRIEGNLYNVETGTRTPFSTEQRDSIYCSNFEIFENFHWVTLELYIYLNGDRDMKQIAIDLAGKIELSDSRVQILNLNVVVGLLGLEVNYPDYQLGDQVKDDLEIKAE
ncbi:hypothetical protein [Butyricimonas synergistica]|uniref:hypothetical protein n=1 Tax=Butyricimonas synergistica TaxID=544644 RepID=UPI00037BDC13|nr:hypothetical protein [Butyricimonas synergistica]